MSAVGHYHSIGFILVLFILLVIITKPYVL